MRGGWRRRALRSLRALRSSCSSLLLLVVVALATGANAGDTALRIGSKRFTESYILGEIVAHAARQSGAEVEHRLGMGSSGIVFAALRAAGMQRARPKGAAGSASVTIRIPARPYFWPVVNHLNVEQMRARFAAAIAAALKA